nr:PREDICTED: uncharacterized protein LOC109030924 [Bemisia tabaci]XP_018897701.1 PREDICTED: uncharacterized protein LOC109030924 [Bemisia tabaci]XP_018897702.1 PREDICTED: uncharacterized protein LOC109030924 [Bemisia tabaci]
MIKDLYITHVEAFGGLLQVWAQCDMTNCEKLERNIKKVSNLLETNVITNPIEQLSNGKLCLLKLRNDEYFRVKILSLQKLEQQTIPVFLVDYGNIIEVRLQSLRLIDTHQAMNPFITGIPFLASLFYVAEVQAPGNGWPPQVMDFIRQILACKCFKCNILDGEILKNLIQIFVAINPPTTLSTILLSRGVANYITVQTQTAFIQSLTRPNGQEQRLAPPKSVIKTDATVNAPGVITRITQSMTPISTDMIGSSSGIVSVPVPAAPSTPPILRNPTPDITVKQFITVKFTPGSRHTVYISHVEDGVFAFAVHLKADAENSLPDLMNEINGSYKPEPIEGILMPGAPCLANSPSDRVIYRAVVMDVAENQVKVYYVDFGHSECLSPSDIFKIPTEFMTQKVMATKFSLAGVREDPAWRLKTVKTYFLGFVYDKELIMDVTSNKTPSPTHSCDLYYNGYNVRELLQEQLDKIVPFAHRDPLTIAVFK